MPERNAHSWSRRSFLAAAGYLPAAQLPSGAAETPPGTSGSTVLDVDYRKLVSSADLDFKGPITRSELGLPIGNGRMGTLLWTDRNAIKLQINRVDVFAANSHTESLIDAPPTPSLFPAGYQDYCCGCGVVDIAFEGPRGAGMRAGPFPSQDVNQHLSVYDATVSIEGNGCKAQAFASADRDVMAVHLESLPGVSRVKVVLRMLRPPLVTTRKHTASSTLTERDGRIVLRQVFEEGDFYCSSAVAIGLAGGKGVMDQTRDMSMQVSFEASQAPVTVFIASAATFARGVDPSAAALQELEKASATGIARVLEAHKRWWSEFWSKSFILVPGFRELERTEAMYLYLMGSSSRGSIPPKYNGELWNTRGDQHEWGSQFWWWNQSTVHHSVYASNHLELNDPLFTMITANLRAYATAARQQWGSQGIWIPETQWLDGIEELPDDIAAELSDLYLEREPFDKMSSRLRQAALRKHPLSARWNFMHLDKVGGQWGHDGPGIFGYVSHIIVVGPKISHLYWLRYEYTLDRDWLRERAYPVLRGAAEFYRNFPNLKKEADGKYHINRTHSHEHLWGARDVMDDLGLMRGIFPTVIRASEILGVDADMRPIWQEVVTNLAPYPYSDMPGAELALKHPKGLRTWAEGYQPCVLTRGGGPESPRLRPLLEYDVLTLESEDQETRAVAMATLDAHPGSVAGAPQNETARFGTEAARAGRADLVRQYLINLREKPMRTVLPNGLSTLEGGGSMQYLGTYSDAVQQALLQCVAPKPGGDPVLRVFPAWPAEWDAAFQLLAKGGFLVTSSMRRGQVEFVEVRSQLGGECRLRNPWATEGATLYRNGKKAEDLAGSLLRLPTSRDEILILVKKGTAFEQFKRAV
jgi:hypothetical protein